LKESSSITVGVTGAHNNVADNRLIIPNPTQPGAPDEGVILVASNGAQVRFAATWSDQYQQQTQYAASSLSDWSLSYRAQASIDFQYEVRSKTGDISYFYHGSDGYLRKITSAQGGELNYLRSSQEPEKLTAIEDGNTSRSIQFTYDAYDRLIMKQEWDDTTPGRAELYLYDQDDRLVEYENAFQESLFFEYDLVDRLVAVKQAVPSSSGKGSRSFSTMLMPLVTFSYDPTSSSPAVTAVANSCEEEYFLVRDLQEQTSTVTDPLLRDTVFEYYHEGSLASILDPSLSVKAFFPDSERASTNVKRIRGCGAEEDSREQVFEYDENRNLTSLTDADGNTSSWTYNSRNKPTSYTDREENTWEYEYTQDGDQIAKTTDPLGRETIYSYAQDKKIQSISRPYLQGSPAVTSFTHDSYGYIDTVTDALNRVVDRDYDAWGRLMQVTDPAGRISAFTYDALSRPTDITVTVPQVGSKSIGLSYNAQGQLASITRPDESSTLYRYDACGRVSEAEDALGNITSYSYDAAGRLIEVEDPLGRTMSMQYDTLNRLIALTDPKEKTTSYQYDTLGRLQQVTTPLGQVTNMRYDALNRLVELEDPLEGISSFVWNKEGFLTEMTNPRGATWNMNYNEAYQLVSVQGPLQTETSYEYYPFGGLKKVTNALEQSVQYEYDAAYRLTKIKDIQLRETTLSYTERDQLSQITLPGNRSTQFWYDGFGNLVKRRNALNQEVEMEYDISNQLTAFIDELDQRTEYEYDLLGRLISSKSPLGYERFYTYDEVSNMTSFEDPLSHVTEWVYDVRNQVEKMTDPLLLESSFDYDEKGRLTQVTDPLLRVHSFSYDQLDRLSEVLTPEERSASYSYDAGGLLLERSRPATSQSLASVSSYSYDALGRSTEVENPLGESTTLSWNVLSQLLSVSYPTEESVEYSYDAYQRLSTITASDQRSITMSYDTYDRLTEIEHSVTGSYEYSYDVLDRVTQETSPDSLVTTLSYDAAGKVTEQIWNQQSTEFSYDADSRLTGIDAPGNRSYTLSYDAANRLLTETLPTTGAVDYLQDAGDRLTSQIYTLPGSLGGAPGGKPSRKQSEEAELSSAASSRKLFFTAYEYARLVIGWYLREGQVRQLRKEEGGQLKGKAWEAQVALLNWWRQSLLTPITIASFSPVWDDGDRITEEEIVLGQQNQERSYTYDDDDQLLSAELPSGTFSYTYDERYNRLSQRIETLSTDTTDFYTYNVADQLVERVRKDTSTQTVLEEESFSYNEVGELTSRTLTIGLADATTQYVYEVGGKLKQVILPDLSTVTYAYDALGNRIRKLSSSLDIHYQYSQGACRREIHKDPVTQNTLRTITYHPWGMSILVNQTTTDYYFITDFRGWVWGLTDDSGTIVESYNYDPFGRMLAGSLLSHARFLSGAHEGQWDAEVGLYYLGARYYDPSLGRFIQEDAVEGAADLPASQNRYVYCQNDPVALIDPTGYSPENTGTPIRFTPMNYANIKSSEGGINSCYLEDYTPVVAEVQDPNRSPIDMAEAGRQAAARDAAHLRTDRMKNPTFAIEGMFDSNDGCKEYYTWVSIGGVLVKVVYDGSGVIIRVESTSMEGFFVGIAIQMALNRIQLEGGITSAEELRLLLESVNSFALANYSTFKEIFNSNDDSTRCSFAYHAVIGGYVATQMQKYGKSSKGYDYDQYDMTFGFWASFYSSILSIPISIHPSKYNTPQPNDSLSLIDVANILKAIAYQETRIGEDGKTYGDNGHGFGGIMQVPIHGEKNKKGIRTGKFIFEEMPGGENSGAYIKGAPTFKRGNDPGFFNPFNNIGIGAGYLFGKLLLTSYPYHSSRNAGLNPPTPTLSHWLEAVIKYGDQTEQYHTGVMSAFLYGTHARSDKPLFDARFYFKYRRIYRPKKT